MSILYDTEDLWAGLWAIIMDQIAFSCPCLKVCILKMGSVSKSEINMEWEENFGPVFYTLPSH